MPVACAWVFPRDSASAIAVQVPADTPRQPARPAFFAAAAMVVSETVAALAGEAAISPPVVTTAAPAAIAASRARRLVVLLRWRRIDKKQAFPLHPRKRTATVQDGDGRAGVRPRGNGGRDTCGERSLAAGIPPAEPGTGSSVSARRR